jgi:release factor glutamine methyltransferase
MLAVRNYIEIGGFELESGPHPEQGLRDSERLLLHVLGRDRTWLAANQRSGISHEHHRQWWGLIQRRLTGEPIQYITGETEFYGLPFRVTPAVLIPRPETEHLVEEVLKRAIQLRVPQVPLGTWEADALSSPGTRPPTIRILDIGTGSGCIAVALARHLPLASITAIDLSPDALAVARENAALNGVADRIRFLPGDLLAPVANESFDIVVSNPPYVPTADRSSLSIEVRDHEPALALFAGDDGLDLYRRIAPAADRVLAPGGLLALEIGFAQQAAITALLTAAGFQSIEAFPDLQGIPRVVCAVRGHA